MRTRQKEIMLPTAPTALEYIIGMSEDLVIGLVIIWVSEYA